MGKCSKDFNSKEFRDWLSRLHEGIPDTRFCKEEDGVMEAYYYVSEQLLGSIVIWEDKIVEEIIENRNTEEQVFYLHYEMVDRDQVKTLIRNFKNRMFCVCQKEYSISDDDVNRKILLCCSSGLTTSMFASLLQDFSNENKLPYQFEATSIFDTDAFSKGYDIVLMAPQIQHRTKEIASQYCQKFLNLDPSDFAQYNCRNIISRIQDAVM